MKVKIEFNINERDYDQYEGILQEFLHYMSQLGYDKIDVTET